MSDAPSLGAADGESRWIGVRRHQAALAILGVGLIGEWLTHTHGASIELVGGLVALSCAAPTRDGVTVGERMRSACDFTLRSRWTSIRVTLRDGVTTLNARGEATVRSFQLLHRGRLDLSGRDQHNALALAEFADALSTSNDTRHFSQHVCSTPTGVTTTLAVPADVTPPSSWRENHAAARATSGVRDGSGAVWLLERWTYLRDERGVMRVLRVRDFSSVPDGHALLDRLQFASESLDVVVHVDVVAGERAHRLAARAVHRVGSDDATSRAAGFRRTAQSVRALDRLRQREALVVEGAALLRIGVFIVIRATSLSDLRRDVRAVLRTSLESGLRCQPGAGQQARWYCAQLAGGPGW